MKKEALLAVVLATGVMAEAASAEPAAVNAEAVRTSSARVTLVAPYPQPEPGAEPGPRISLQYAVQHLAKQAGYGYLFQESQTRIGDVARLWTTPEIRDMPFDEAIADVLRPHGLAYEISDGKVLLTLRRVTIAPPYPMAYPGAREDQISVQYAVRMIGEQVQLRYDFEASLRNVGESARRWVAPEFRDVPFAEAMRALLNPLGLRYEVVADTIVLVK